VTEKRVAMELVEYWWDSNSFMLSGVEWIAFAAFATLLLIYHDAIGVLRTTGLVIAFVGLLALFYSIGLAPLWFMLVQIGLLIVTLMFVVKHSIV